MALQTRTIKQKLTDLGVWNDSLTPAVSQLCDVDSVIEQMQKTISDDGYSVKTKSRENNDRITGHPLIQEMIKLQSVKMNLLKELLLTPAAMAKTELQKKEDDGFDDI